MKGGTEKEYVEGGAGDEIDGGDMVHGNIANAPSREDRWNQKFKFAA